MDKATLLTIKKLFALADGTSFPEEAATAIGKAQALMLKYKVDQAMLENVSDENVEDVQAFTDSPLNEEDRGKSQKSYWKLRLSSVLCEYNGCYMFSRGKDIMLVGKPSDVATIRYLYEYCIREIDRLTKRNCIGQGRTYSNNFRIGCVTAIDDAMQSEQTKIREKIKADLAANCKERGLIVLDKALAKIAQDRKDAMRFASKKFKLRSGGQASFRGDSAGRLAGRAAGSSIYKGKGTAGIGAPQGRIS